MNRAIPRSLSLQIRSHLLDPLKSVTNPITSSFIVVSRTRSTQIFYSSESDTSHEAKFARTQTRHGEVDDVAGVSNHELKKRIEKYYEGDEEAIPEIFEAILKRKLAGISDKDDELMAEVG
ncbi:hypothetical protein P3X46_017083 [Hevea brasiliensis]|uniref:Uncharacterized protein n=1 Tax=Hevea brasiliensis TaxID=3981 RepID=A0ABQ9M545_HEVBR|nr:uncharacterized protein LOC110643307 [Hevea brasiliensis]KAJ9174008.1 hypothetical protein P3X46_017083 [Hevea brasiliensis]